MSAYKTAAIKVKNLQELKKEREEERKKENKEEEDPKTEEAGSGGRGRGVALDLHRELMRRMLAEQRALRERRASETTREGEGEGPVTARTHKSPPAVEEAGKKKIEIEATPVLMRPLGSTTRRKLAESAAPPSAGHESVRRQDKSDTRRVRHRTHGSSKRSAPKRKTADESSRHLTTTTEKVCVREHICEGSEGGEGREGGKAGGGRGGSGGRKRDMDVPIQAIVGVL